MSAFFRTMKKNIVIITCLLVLLAASALAYEVPARAGRYFHNTSSTMKLVSSQEQALEDRLSAIKMDFGGTEMAVLVIESLEGEAIEARSLKVAEAWNLGQKRKTNTEGDNGLLLVVAIRDKKYRFEVGYGLESVLPDSLTGSLGRDTLVPAFREGRYLDGLYKAIDAVRKQLGRSRQQPASVFEIPPFGDKRFHNYSTLLKLQDYEASGLETHLESFEFSDNPIRMAVLVVDSLQGETIDSLSQRAAKKWNIGNKRGDGSDGDNGVLLVLAMKERKYRFELGQELDALLPESLADAIGRAVMIQDFWAGEYGRGLERTIEAVNFAVQGEYPQSVALYEQNDDRGLGERLFDLVRYQKLSRPTSYDYLYQGRERTDPAWGGGDHKKEVRTRWTIIIMIGIAALAGIYDFRLGGIMGLIEGASYSWFFVPHAVPLILLYAAAGFIIGLAGKYVVAGALIAGAFVTAGGKFGGGGASGNW
jgi:uncharacterized membrane protein YgcG